MDKTNYKTRREYCAHKMLTDKVIEPGCKHPNSYFWWMAFETYSHLISCDKSHHLINGKVECEWQAEKS